MSTAIQRLAGASGGLDALMRFCADDLLIGIVALAGVLIWIDRWAVRAAITVPVGAGIALGLSAVIHVTWNRPRPFVSGHFAPLIAHDASPSFPSDHLALLGGVTAAVLACSVFRGLLVAALSAIVGFARVFVGVHDIWDIAGGVAIGLAAGAVVWTLVGRVDLDGLDGWLRRRRLLPRQPIALSPFVHDLETDLRPLWRGLLHQWAFLVSLLAGVALIAVATPGAARESAVVYAVSLSVCLGVSAGYHRGPWRPRTRAFLSRVDHATIFVLVAGTITPLLATGLGRPAATTMLAILWTAAGGGAILSFAWPNCPGAIEVGPYVALSSAGLAALPHLLDDVGVAAVVLLVLGGVVYVSGAIVYARHRPDPWPGRFGFHEIFHTCTLLAMTVHWVLLAAVVEAAHP